MELLPRLLNPFPSDAVQRVIIDQSHGLHECKRGGGAEKCPAALFKLFC